MAIFYNRATLSYNGQSLNSNQVSGEISESLSITKTAISASYGVGDNIAYLISISNSGFSGVESITLRDDLGAFNFGDTTLVPLTYREGSLLYYIDGVLQPAPTVNVGTELVISGINIPAGSVATLVYEANVNGYAPLGAGASITNTSEINGCQAGTSISDSATVPAEEDANLSISKAVYPQVITCSGELTYTFIIQNTGNADVDADGDLIASDNFDPILSDIVVTLNGETLTEGTDYTYDEATGAFATLPGVVTVGGASFERDPETGLVTATPGVSVLTVAGNV